jgi:Domain of unknown function (DUF4386)
MSSDSSKGEIPKASPRLKARVTGAVYLLYFLTAVSAVLLVGRGQSTYGFAASFISIAFYGTLTVLFYYLFRPVNSILSLLAAIIGLAGCLITVLNLFHLAAQISPLVFFGPYCLLLGYLILRSTFLPRILGALMVLAGLGWLTFLIMPPTSRASGYIEALGIVAEGLLMLWLLVLGVNPERWSEQAAESGRARTNLP